MSVAEKNIKSHTIEINVNHSTVNPASNISVHPAYNIVHVNKHPETGHIDSKLELIIKEPDDITILPPKYMSPPARRANEDILKTLIMEYISQLNNILAIKANDRPGTTQKVKHRLNDNIVSGLSHRVKTPLTAIVSGIQLMYNYEHDEFIGRILDYLMQSSVELTKFINDIIDFYYINQGILELDIELTSMADQIKYVHDVYASQLKDESITFTYNISAGVPEHFYSDKRRLSQVFINLVNNSITALGLNNATEPKAINIDCSLVSNNRIRVLIQDTGPGINLSSNTELLFDPFNGDAGPTADCMFQHPATAQEPRMGIGLGLAITRMLLNKIGAGVIKFVKPNRWYKTAIEFEFDMRLDKGGQASPVLDKGGQASPIPNEFKPALLANNLEYESSSKEIILVDDNEKNMTLLTQIIKNIIERKYTHYNNITGFINPASAYNYLLAAGARIKLLFLDIKMPGMSGYDIIQGLWENYDGQIPFKIIILSALPKLSILAKLRMLGVLNGINNNITVAAKPYDMAEIESFIIPEIVTTNHRITTV